MATPVKYESMSQTITDHFGTSEWEPHGNEMRLILSLHLDGFTPANSLDWWNAVASVRQANANLMGHWTHVILVH